MSEPAIIATRLAKTYGDVVALGGIDLEAHEGTSCEPFVVLPANVNGEH